MSQAAFPHPTLLALALALGACNAAEPPRDQEPGTDTAAAAPRAACDDHSPLRNAYFGDLHIHTALSFDAYTSDTRALPDDAYRFARGEPLRLPPLDAQGHPTREIRLERPLDFAAVTDHAEWIGEVSLCTQPGSRVYDVAGCRIFRGETPSPSDSLAGRMAGLTGATPDQLLGQVSAPGRSVEVCGPAGRRCLEAQRTAWGQTRAATERWNDRSPACRFTAFHAYEYTATPQMSKVHRNVVFRNATVPERPISYLEEPVVEDLFRELAARCNDAGSGCEALTIPHNSNLSNGRMFTVTGRDAPLHEQRARATLRARMEPLVEIMQTKGDSECRNGMYAVVGPRDELCDFEKFRRSDTPDCEEGTGAGALMDRGCVSRLDFVRYALIEGLREQSRLGVNPYRLGITASTDTHNAAPGDTEEASFDGVFGVRDADVASRLSTAAQLSGAITNPRLSPGGLVGVWAEENARDALFDAMQRRETFGTSGPRIAPRLFGGWSYDSDLCASPALVERGYAGGVPMGGDLPPAPAGGGAPVLVVSALRDPGAPGLATGKLQRMQVIKGWVGADGAFHQQIHDVAGGVDPAATVDLETCEVSGPGHDSLCAVWTDPDFDPGLATFYYARALENPACRWNAHHCAALPADARPPLCSDPDVPRVTQERAWTSPIWYTPPTT